MIITVSRHQHRRYHRRAAIVPAFLALCLPSVRSGSFLSAQLRPQRVLGGYATVTVMGTAFHGHGNGDGCGVVGYARNGGNANGNYDSNALFMRRRNRDCIGNGRKYHRTSSALMGLFDDNSGGKKEGIADKALSKIKGFFGGNDEKKKAEIVSSDRSSTSAGGLMNEMLKDAPFPIRMMGKMMTPIISSLAEGMQEQVKQVEDLIDDARIMIISDAQVVDMLGEPIEVATAPFQQSSSSTNINGKMTTRVQASFQVQGSRGSGIASMLASGGEKASIEQLSVNVGGRTLNVNTSSASSRFNSSSYSGSSSVPEDGIIDAEFVEKKYNR